MISTVYIEREIQDHPRVQSILSRLSDPEVILCSNYREVFNIKSQNFREQKKKPSLILARKPKSFVQNCPIGFGTGGVNNHYFSHMLNCVYDCRYCFLQGMYKSANYVIFVNFEDFFDEISNVANNYNVKDAHDTWFYSGYDCDSLVFEPWTKFIEESLTAFENIPAYLELRTKSTQTSTLLKREALPNVVVAYSLTSSKVHKHFEGKVPSIDKRVNTMAKLSEHGWKIGLRFDPLIWFDDYLNDFEDMIEDIFSKVSQDSVHSASIGGFRLPKAYFRQIKQLYPENKLFSQYFEEVNGMMAFPKEKEREMLVKTKKILEQHIDGSSIYAMT